MVRPAGPWSKQRDLALHLAAVGADPQDFADDRPGRP
jgi:hypothetical protein